jgi:uncharacterized surface protein with fasciclin (FAS1) repeats
MCLCAQVVLHHIVPNYELEATPLSTRLISPDLTPVEFRTFYDDLIVASVESGDVRVAPEDLYADPARVLWPNIWTCAGVVHVIDAVLAPKFINFKYP